MSYRDISGAKLASWNEEDPNFILVLILFEILFAQHANKQMENYNIQFRGSTHSTGVPVGMQILQGRYGEIYTFVHN